MNLQGARRGMGLVWGRERRLSGAFAASLLLHAAVLLPPTWARPEFHLASPLQARLQAAPPPAPPATPAISLDRQRPAEFSPPARKDVSPAPPATAVVAVPRPPAPPRLPSAGAAGPAAASRGDPLPQAEAAPASRRAPAPQALLSSDPASGGAPAAQAGPDPQALTRYRFAVARAVVRRYPPLAIERGLTGEARVRLAFAGGARPPEVSVSGSSGHALLDAEAKAMIRRAAERAALPEALRGVAFSVDLPVIFDLDPEAGE